MDTNSLLTVGILLLGFSLATALVIVTTFGAVRRSRESLRQPPSKDLEARLTRLEAAVDAIRLDVSRLVEYQRLAQRAEPAQLADRAAPPRTTTPH